jgi:hypothetical protein
MKWFTDNSVQREENTVDQIEKLAGQWFTNTTYPNFVDTWNEKDQSLFRKCSYIIILSKENAELKGVIGGNKEYFGQFQDKFNKVHQELEITNHHLELEKQAYQKLYMEKRDLEAKLYTAGRELELRGYFGKDLT